ncbi:MAG: quinolinate synthase NadA [Bacteriovoracaceae bacterium]
MLELYSDNLNDHLPKIGEAELSDDEVLAEITYLKNKLQDELVILGHHYQQDDIIRFADITGDSLALAKEAQKLRKKHIIFCGVHFMAETADMLISPDQFVMLPDLNAGCSMADMAQVNDIEVAWNFIQSAMNVEERIIPITYINCAATLKAFVGDHGGSICTSSNAKKIITWGLSQGEKLFFFPDQHLGRNTCFDLGIPLEQMVIYNPKLTNGGLTVEQVRSAKVILWYGYCSVHQGFNKKQIDDLRVNRPQAKIIVHPECSFDVVQNADLNGSTAFIIDHIANAPEGSEFAVGTEINLVNRIAEKFKHQNKKIYSLSNYQCLCTTMYRVRPRWLLNTLRAIEANDPINVIRVPNKIKKSALTALNRMLTI